MSTTDMCQRVEEELAGVLDGSASAELFDHLAGCDRCRDLKHDAAEAAGRVGAAGKDFRVPEGFAEGLIERILAARPSGVEPATERGLAGAEPATERGLAGPALPAADEPARPAPTKIEQDPAFAATVHATTPSARTPERAPVERVAEATTSPVRASERAPVEPVAAAEPARAPERAPVERVAEAALPAAFVDRPAAREPRAREPAPVLAARSDAARPAPSGGRLLSFVRRPALLVGLAGAVAAAAGVGFYLKGRSVAPGSAVTAAAPWSGSVATIARASADKTGGLDVCDAAGACAPAAGGGAIPAGATLRTDARTRAHVTLGDGTELALDRSSEVELVAGATRTAMVKRGSIVADVAHVDGSTAHFGCAQGDVEVLGTKIAMTAGDGRASVEVVRGTVRFVGTTGKPVEVRAGEEATLVKGAEPVVAASSSLADVMEWSDRSPEDVDAPVLRGLGELRARRPGATAEKDHAVQLARHAVKVRIVDVVARTEVDEVFANDSDEELEGIFRFPLPPGAQIERLALEVDGKLVEGAFVDRDRGAAIWRGVIQNAAPKAPRPREEIIWVPGPWRDPALLEWQRGGRFELKIFPIPKRGTRRVVLTYTQTVDQAGGVRRYTYPLAHDANGTTKVGAFDLDVQVLGLDKAFGVSTRGYELTSASGDGERRTMHADGFVPAGDLTVEYALPDRDREVTAWAYAGAPLAVAPPDASPPPGGRPQTPDDRAAADAAAAIAGDASPYVAIALRPRLPRWQEAKERVHVLVVDASRSMVGERFGRATHLASAIVREMDRRDAFLLLACDTVCRPMGAQGGGAPRPLTPGAAAADEVEKFLGPIEPDGGSDLAAAMAAARTAAGPLGGKELRILYLGDGTPTVGPTRPAHLEAAVRSALPTGDGAVVAVALGSDADMISLGALARGGGGVVVPYVPGQKVSSAALDALGAAYGVMLRDPRVELPAGLTQVTPAQLDPIRAGGETILVARMSGSDVGGTLKLHGRVAGEVFDQSYPVKILASSSAGNAFVPRLYAAAKIAELERTGGDQQKAMVIALSRRFAVASRFTSLLVLESEAMFKAFGVERGSIAPSFTGEQQAESSSADGDAPVDDKSNDVHVDTAHGEAKAKEERSARSDDASPGGSLAGIAGGGARGSANAGAPAPAAVATMAPPAAAPMADGRAMPQGMPGQPFPPPPPRKSAAVAGPSTPADMQPNPFDSSDPWTARRPRRMIPMRKVFDRKASFDPGNTLAQQNAARLAIAESASSSAPDSRDKTVDLYVLYATSGRLGEAQELTARWSGRDALDPDALTARADLAARQGERDRAIRILGGLADVRPNDRALQTRLADLQDAAGNPALACEHRIALADLALTEAKLVADAVRCARTQGQADLASLLRIDAGDRVRDAIDRLLAAGVPPVSGAVGGDVQLTADWTGGGDLDLALIDAQGRRSSWLGSPLKGVSTSRDATNPRAETLGFAGLPSGNYLLEISRAGGGNDPSAATPARGNVTIRLPGGVVRQVPFSLTGARAEVGTIRIFFTSRLVPLDSPWGR